MAMKGEDGIEVPSCFCIKVGTGCLFVGFFGFVGLMMELMAFSFALWLQSFKAFWVRKNGKLKRVYFKSYHTATKTTITIYETVYSIL